MPKNQELVQLRAELQKLVDRKMMSQAEMERTVADHEMASSFEFIEKTFSIIAKRGIVTEKWVDHPRKTGPNKGEIIKAGEITKIVPTAIAKLATEASPSGYLDSKGNLVRFEAGGRFGETLKVVRI